MTTNDVLAAARSFVVPIPPWVALAVAAAALAFLIGLVVLLLVLSRRSRWPERPTR